MKWPIIILLIIVGAIPCIGQQMVYKPINSAFGGDNYNYNWLLSSANAQNQFKANTGYAGLKPNTAISGFQENLNRQLLNKISNGLFGGSYDDTKMDPGVYNLGSLNVTIAEYFGGLYINIIDILTGEQTNINLPNSY